MRGPSGGGSEDILDGVPVESSELPTVTGVSV